MNTEKTKSTMLIISMGFLFLYLILSWKWAIIVSFSVGIVGIASPFLSRKIEWAWMKLAHAMGYIVPNILLTLTFFLFLYPLSLLSRLFRKDPLMLSKKYKSYFIDINKEMPKESFEKIW
jgi:ABC-type multidrug transport system fused ATPase/permease subunit